MKTIEACKGQLMALTFDLLKLAASEYEVNEDSEKWYALRRVANAVKETVPMLIKAEGMNTE
jgi:hypothetical protein